MVRINLLPHRQIKREERKREFNMMLAGTAILGIALVFLGHSYISSQVESQTERNTRMEKAIADLDGQISEIKDLKNKISDVLDRKQVVENLQTNRAQAVVLLDELSRKLPEGIYLRGIHEQGNLITIDGVADTNARVATMVRNYSSSEFLQSPNLVEIKADTVNGIKRNAFTLSVQQKIPATASDEHAANKPKGQ
jgi:type IV pilus assembly protein PilN